jgi:hypothetical protein
MLNRRDFLIATGSALLMTDQTSNASAAVLPTSASTPQPVLTPTEQLMYSAIRLVNQKAASVSSGTGLIFNLFNTKSSQVPVIVTNRHVVEGSDQCTFNLVGRLADGSPDLKNHIPVQLPQFQTVWTPHPDVDLVIIPIGQILNELRQHGRAPYVIALDPSLIPTDDELKSLMPVEQILTVGFPGQLWDDVHNLPVFHRGFTATAPYIDFKGKREFLIDIATWPGSSGSPVMLFNEGSWVDRTGGVSLGGMRIKLLGVVYGVAVQDVAGNVLIQNAPTQITSVMVPTNLGACIQASRILEFEPLLVSKGVKPPAGYVMRAK